MLKGILIIVWVAIVANLFIVLPDALVWPLKALGVLLAVAHIAEFFIFRKDIEGKRGRHTKIICYDVSIWSGVYKEFINLGLMN